MVGAREADGIRAAAEETLQTGTHSNHRAVERYFPRRRKRCRRAHDLGCCSRTDFAGNFRREQCANEILAITVRVQRGVGVVEGFELQKGLEQERVDARVIAALKRRHGFSHGHDVEPGVAHIKSAAVQVVGLANLVRHDGLTYGKPIRVRGLRDHDAVSPELDAQLEKSSTLGCCDS